jgi:histidine triad (HIT) family protein
MSNCIFCNIVQHQASADIIFEDPEAMVIRDRNPQAPVHLLVIPKKHIEKIQDTTADDEGLLGHLILLAKQEAEKAGLNRTGYRLIFNNGRQGGQAVFHIHLHLLGGRAMHWPPG